MTEEKPDQAKLDLIKEYDAQFAAVQRYQNGDPEAAIFMLEKFEEFLNGFILMIRGQQIKQMTWSHRIFLSNFVKNSGLSGSLKSRTPVSAAFLAAESAITTISIQMRPIDDEDLRQEVIEVFLATLRRYKSRDNQNFLIPYILKSFPYALTRRVQSLIKDPLVNLASDKIVSLQTVAGYDRIEVGNHPSAADISKHLTTTYKDSVHSVEEDTLGHSWLAGDTCDERFDVLTYSERKLILSFYYRQMTDSQIAKSLGVSYNTAIRRRHHIEAKLHGKYVAPACKFCGVSIPKSTLGRQPRQCDSCRVEKRADRQRLRKNQKKLASGSL